MCTYKYEIRQTINTKYIQNTTSLFDMTVIFINLFTGVGPG